MSAEPETVQMLRSSSGRYQVLPKRAGVGVVTIAENDAVWIESLVARIQTTDVPSVLVTGAAPRVWLVGEQMILQNFHSPWQVFNVDPPTDERIREQIPLVAERIDAGRGSVLCFSPMSTEHFELFLGHIHKPGRLCVFHAYLPQAPRSRITDIERAIAMVPHLSVHFELFLVASDNSFLLDEQRTLRELLSKESSVERVVAGALEQLNQVSDVKIKQATMKSESSDFSTLPTWEEVGDAAASVEYDEDALRIVFEAHCACGGHYVLLNIRRRSIRGGLYYAIECQCAGCRRARFFPFKPEKVYRDVNDLIKVNRRWIRSASG